MKWSTGVILGGILAGVASAQSAVDGGCLRLLGSVACPGFQYAYISPSNLSNAYPFFESVTDVQSFDVAVLNYFSNPYQWQTTKFKDQLGCTNSGSAMIRWQRTVQCSQWVNERWSEQCLALYNGTSAATSQKMVCQATCLEFAASEVGLVNNTAYCPGPDPTIGDQGREFWLNKDYVDCTNWTTLATNETESCVRGQDNEGSCGFGTSTNQLCDFCRGDSPDSCCYQSGTDVSVCGYSLPPQASTTGAASNDSTSTSKLSGGQIAGIVVGSVVSGLLLVGLLFFLLRAKRRRNNRNRDSTSSFASPSGPHNGVFGGLFNRPTSSPPNNSSEKGLLNRSSAAAASSPTMGGDTLYAGSGHNKSLEGTGVVGAAGAGAAMGMGGAPGERTSGVVLPRVKDENQNGQRWIETGAEVTVLWPYQATLPDELDLRPGMKLRVLRLYDDAWGTAQIIGSEGEVGKQGAFPVVCVSEGSSLGSSQTSSSESH